MESKGVAKFLGMAKRGSSVLRMPPDFSGMGTYQVMELEGLIILIPAPFEPTTAEEVERLARETIEVHRKTLEALAR